MLTLITIITKKDNQEISFGLMLGCRDFFFFGGDIVFIESIARTKGRGIIVPLARR